MAWFDEQLNQLQAGTAPAPEGSKLWGQQTQQVTNPYPAGSPEWVQWAQTASGIAPGTAPPAQYQQSPEAQAQAEAYLNRITPGGVGATGPMVTSPTTAPAPTSGTTPGAAGPTTGLPDGYSLNGANSLASFSAPGLAAPWTQEFQRPDPNTIASDPSYQFQLKQGQEALQRSAAARGTLLTGGTLKELTEFGQGLASTFDDKYYNRAMGEYGMNRGTFWGNQDNAYSRLSGLANTGAGAASSYAGNVGNLQTGLGNTQASATMAGNQNWNNTFGSLAEAGTAIMRKRAGQASNPHGYSS